MVFSRRAWVFPTFGTGQVLNYDMHTSSCENQVNSKKQW